MDVLEALKTSLDSTYRIDREIGSGGMATVFRARDLRHERDVALKVLKPELGAVLGVERFLAEIRVTANLSHPHILPLFDSGEASGLLYYVMPLVNGETLRMRLERERQLPVAEAIRLAVAIAGALDYAHRNRVVHRDLKPENIMLPDGEPVVTDFGIALAVSNAGGARITQTGLSLGTPAYMSPEQAAGDRAIDARSDVYSLGAMVYEMLTGEPPHTGATVQQIIARILSEQPRPLRGQRPSVPGGVENAVHTALSKLPADRFTSARDFGAALGRGLEGGTTTGEVSMAAAAPARSIATTLPWVVAVGAALVAGWAWLRPVAKGPEPPLARFTVEPPGGLRSNFAELALSADGRRLLMAEGPLSSRRVWSRLLGAEETGEVLQLAGARAFALSPDGSAVAFLHEGSLNVTPVQGGSVNAVASLGNGPMFDAPSWGSGGTIVFTRADSAGIWSVPARGGSAAVKVTSPDVARGEEDGAPHFLPDGQHFLFERRARAATRVDLMLGNLSGRESPLGLEGASPQFASGYLVYLTPQGMLTARAFDPDTRTLGNAVVSLAETPMARQARGRAFVTAAAGVMALTEAAPSANQVVALAPDGRLTTLTEERRVYGAPALSPDGRSVAVDVRSPDATSDIWIIDRAGGSRRLTRGGDQHSPVWSPDGASLAYVVGDPSSQRSRLVLHLADGSREPRELVASDGMIRVHGFSANGDSVRFVELTPRSVPRLQSVSVSTGRQTTYLSEPGERAARVSPDGRWLAYVATEDGRDEVFARPSSAKAPIVQLSAGGGDEPRWTPDGRHVVYRDTTGFQQVSISTEPMLRVAGRAGRPTTDMERGGLSSFDVGASGVIVLLKSVSQPAHVDVIVNVASWIRGLSPQVR